MFEKRRQGAASSEDFRSALAARPAPTRPGSISPLPSARLDGCCRKETIRAFTASFCSIPDMTDNDHTGNRVLTGGQLYWSASTRDCLLRRSPIVIESSRQLILVANPSLEDDDRPFADSVVPSLLRYHPELAPVLTRAMSDVIDVLEPRGTRGVGSRSSPHGSSRRSSCRPAGCRGRTRSVTMERDALQASAAVKATALEVMYGIAIDATPSTSSFLFQGRRIIRIIP